MQTDKTESAPELVLTSLPPSILEAIADAYRSGAVLKVLVRRHISIRFSQTFLGVGWLVVQPLFSALAFSILLAVVTRSDRAIGEFFLTTFCGFVPWTVFVQASERSAMSLTWDSGLVTKVYFPRLLLPVAAAGSALADLMVPLVILVATGFVFGKVEVVAWLLLPVGLLVLASAALGLGLSLSALSLRFRDLRQIHTFLFQFWMVVTPVAYPIEMVDSRWQVLFYLNPMTLATGIFRSAFLGSPLPELGFATVSILSSSCILWLGVSLFHAVEPKMADIL